MKKIILILLASAVTAGASRADLSSGPETTFLWNRFNDVVVLDSFALVTSDFGVSSLRLNPVTGRFDPVSNLLLRDQALRVKVIDQTALVTTGANILYVVDLSVLPEMQVVGEFDLGNPVHDALLVGSDLYLACGFDGLRHYRLPGDNTLQFVDSSLTPIHCTQVDLQDQYLIVLDNYNGLLRYRPEAGSLGGVESTLWVFRPVKSFVITGDTLILPLLNDRLLYRAAFDPVPILLDSITLTVMPDCAFAIDTMLVCYDAEAQVIETISTAGGSHFLVSFPDNLELQPFGSAYYLNSESRLVLVSDVLSLASFNLSDLWYDPNPRPGYAHPGPIDVLDFHKGRLVTGGGNSPLELYQIDSPDSLVFDTAYYGPTDVNVVADGGDVLFAGFMNTWPLSALRFEDNSISLLGTLIAPSPPIRDLTYYPHPYNDTTSLLFSQGQRAISLIAVSPSWQMSRSGEAQSLENILDFVVVDSFLVVSTENSQLDVFKIVPRSSPPPPFGVVFWWSIPLPLPLNHIAYTGLNHDAEGWYYPITLLGFSGNQMFEISVHSGTTPPSLFALGTLPFEVTESSLANNRLYTIGPQGISILDITRVVPSVLDFGGYGGDLIACRDSILAVSDGTAIHLYRVDSEGLGPTQDVEQVATDMVHLQPNYPNPFNPYTRINFDLPSATRVELNIFDLIGRRVISLVDGEVTAGRHSVEWDGMDSFGNRVASGVYFYRLTAPGITETRKMVLLK